MLSKKFFFEIISVSNCINAHENFNIYSYKMVVLASYIIKVTECTYKSAMYLQLCKFRLKSTCWYSFFLMNCAEICNLLEKYLFKKFSSVINVVNWKLGNILQEKNDDECVYLCVSSLCGCLHQGSSTTHSREQLRPPNPALAPTKPLWVYMYNKWIFCVYGW